MSGEGRLIDNLMVGDLKILGSVKASHVKRYCFEDFKTQPICQVNNATTALPSGTANTANTALMPGTGNSFEYVAKGTQTIIGMGVLATGGCDVSGDQTDNDGREIVFGGGITSAAVRTFTVGGRAFSARLKFSIVDVSGVDDCAFGFRKCAAYTANFDDYTDLATLNVISGNITIETILNNAATTSTDTTDDWADGKTHELKVSVDTNGAVTYAIDGQPPTTTAAFTFDSGDAVVPFLFFLQTADFSGAITLQEFECGYDTL
jgi:hypothetical protein